MASRWPAGGWWTEHGGRSSAGRALACGAGGRGFESRRSPHVEGPGVYAGALTCFRSLAVATHSADPPWSSGRNAHNAAPKRSLLSSSMGPLPSAYRWPRCSQIQPLSPSCPAAPLRPSTPPAPNTTAGYLVVEGTRIAAMGAGAYPIPGRPGGPRIIDGRGMLATPGLVNTHHHLYQWITRGYAQDATLFGWLTDLYPVWAGIDEETIVRSRRRQPRLDGDVGLHPDHRPPLRVPEGRRRRAGRDHRGRPHDRSAFPSHPRIDGSRPVLRRPSARLGGRIHRGGTDRVGGGHRQVARPVARTRACRSHSRPARRSP